MGVHKFRRLREEDRMWPEKKEEKKTVPFYRKLEQRFQAQRSADSDEEKED